MYLIFIFIFVCSLFIDIITKAMATSLNQSVEVVPNFFYLTYVENRGAAWGIGQGYQMAFIGVSLVFSVLLIYMICKMNLKYKALFYNIAFLLAGTMGNCLDRIFNGYVVDFLDFRIFNYAFPVFNIADILIVCSMFLIVFNVIIMKEDDLFKRENIQK